jgi:hypothetical protein
MNLLKIKNFPSIFILASLVFLTACASVSEEEPLNTNSKTRDIAKADVPANSQQTAQKAETSQPAKDYAALVPNEHKDPNILIGLGPDRLIEMLGPPNFRRADTPAEIWHYRFGGCVLNLILYETGKKKPLEVAHYRVRSIALKTVTDKDCLLGILIDRQKKLDGKTG